jgi:methyltransferase
VVRLGFVALVAGVAGLRLAELVRSRRHEAALRARGAVSHPGQLGWMVGVHVAWLAAMPAEVWLLARPFRWAVAGPALGVFLAGLLLRRWAIRTLGPRWTVKVMTLPEPLVNAGPYRWLRHPNYLGVALEIAALPLVHGAFLTALGGSVANGLVLWRRIRVEDRALA